MSTEIIRNTEGTVFDGCDFVIRLNEKRKIRILQLTDMQAIDSTQRRTPDRLRSDEIKAWEPENFDALCGDHIRSVVAQARPDLIIITGDMTYGSFDDTGSTLLWLCRLMDSFSIPWAPVFGNHDNESRMGVAWQCRQLEESRYCVFRRGSVSGNGNYTVGVAVGDELIRVLHMTDSNGCSASEDESVIKTKGIYPDQMDRIRAVTKTIRKAQKRSVKAFMAFHIHVDVFAEAERAKGYRTDERSSYTIGVDVPAQDGDFGCKTEDLRKGVIETGEGFTDFLKECDVDGVFVGHCHGINTCVQYNGIKWVYGLKTGQYDYHNVGQLGGTLITVEGDEFDVTHVPSLTILGAYPRKSPILNGLVTEERENGKELY